MLRAHCHCFSEFSSGNVNKCVVFVCRSVYSNIIMESLPGTASLIAEIDKKTLVVLRDGRTLIGFLRSIDQFANLVLHRTIERIHVGKQFGDIPRGVFVVRGENVMLIGEIDKDNEDKFPLDRVSIDDILEAQRAEQLKKQEEEKSRNKKLLERGLQPHADTTHEEFA